MPKYDVTIHIAHGFITDTVDAVDSEEAFDAVYDNIGLTKFSVDDVEIEESEDV